MSHTSHAGAVSVDERRVSTPHGAIFVREAPGDEPAVVLMHGFPDDQRIYARLLPLLSPRRAVTFDFLGYGRSDRSATAGFTPDDHAAQITAVLDALDIRDAVLVGHDASGPDAVFYTLAHPERVAHLALLKHHLRAQRRVDHARDDQNAVGARTRHAGRRHDRRPGATPVAVAAVGSAVGTR
jgi:pimeloyl-ACP methyl ester carboxylesterase